MDNENQIKPEVATPEPQTPAVATMPAKPATPQPAQKQEQPKKKTLKYVLFGLAVVILGGVGYFGYSNPQLFKASVTEVAQINQPAVPATTYLYIPTYDSSPKDSGTISIKTKNGATDSAPTAETIVSMQFKIKYSPVGALTFNENSIAFDTTTLFKSADLKSINTDTPGEISVSFFSNTGALVDAKNQTLVKLAVDVNGTAGSSINLSVSDVEVIKKVGAVYSASTQFATIASDKINLVTQNKLRVLNAEALSNTRVLVRFSDLLKDVGPPTEYTIAGLTVSAAVTGYANPDFPGYNQSTVILTTSAQTPGEPLVGLPYVLQLGTNNFITGNTKGSPDPNYSKAYFEGYKNPDGVANSAVQISSVDVKSSTEVVLNFSGGLLASSVTPVNIKITDTTGVSGTPLTVSNAVLSVSGNSVTLTTDKQVADRNYFVRFSGVKDTTTGNLPLVNNRILNFLGYSVPPMTIANIKPSTVVNSSDQVIVAVGQNLDTIAEIRVGSTTAIISGQTAGALNFTVPKDFTPDIYDVTFVNKTGDTKLLEKGLVVTAPTVQMKIISEQSKSIPARVAPDGKTKVTFWVLVEDPVALANIDSVTMDLEQIGGVRAQEMVKDTGLQKKSQQFYTFTTTVSANTVTKKDAYKLPVEVRKGAETVKGTVDIVVTNDVTASIPPTVDQAYVNPSTVTPDGKTKVKISAKVSDQDGADKIKSVVADLGPLGAGFITLAAIDVAGGANEQITGWFESAEFTVPTTTKEGTYKVTVTASNATGDIGTADINLIVSTTATGPKIDTANTYISPRKSVPKDGKTAFNLNAMITDPDGVSDIDSVTAYFTTLGIKPVTLLKDPNASDAGKTALFASTDITVPTTAPLGVHEIQIVATDKSGGTGSAVLQLDVTAKDTVGEAPMIFTDKSYIAPKVAINDGQTAVTLYTFVRDDDDNLESVVVNLSNIGQVGPEALPDLGGGEASAVSAVAATDTNDCSTNSASIVCMQASYKEGSNGQWFVLPNVTVSTSTPPSSIPYKAEVIATDKTGNVSRGSIPIYVQSGTNYAETKNPPAILAAVSTAANKVEVMFSKELSALSVSSAGSDFTITDKNDTKTKLNVSGATINADGNLVTLTTDPQAEGKAYALTVGGKIKDQAGNALVAGKSSRADFNGFEQNTKQPSMYIVSGTDPETIYLEFQSSIKPSSVKVGQGLSDYDVQVYESDNQSNMLQVKDVEFAVSGNALEVTTSEQKSGQKYIVQIKNISSAAGVQLKTPIAKIFKAVKVSAIKQAAVANQADLNGDGKIDFTDFTMFSAVYGKVFAESITNSGSVINTDTSGAGPIIPPPDSTVPHTSSPSGGAIPTEADVTQ